MFPDDALGGRPYNAYYSKSDKTTRFFIAAAGWNIIQDHIVGLMDETNGIFEVCLSRKQTAVNSQHGDVLHHTISESDWNVKFKIDNSCEDRIDWDLSDGILMVEIQKIDTDHVKKNVLIAMPPGIPWNPKVHLELLTINRVPMWTHFIGARQTGKSRQMMSYLVNKFSTLQKDDLAILVFNSIESIDVHVALLNKQHWEGKQIVNTHKWSLPNGAIVQFVTTNDILHVLHEEGVINLDLQLIVFDEVEYFDGYAGFILSCLNNGINVASSGGVPLFAMVDRMFLKMPPDSWQIR